MDVSGQQLSAHRAGRSCQRRRKRRDAEKYIADALEISELPVTVPFAEKWSPLWLELQRQPRLLLFDDVDTESLAAALREFTRWLPDCPVVATSRLQTFGGDWIHIQLAPLSRQEAYELLMVGRLRQRRLHPHAATAEQIAETSPVTCPWPCSWPQVIGGAALPWRTSAGSSASETRRSYRTARRRPGRMMSTSRPARKTTPRFGPSTRCR